MTQQYGGNIEKGKGGKLGHGLDNEPGDVSVNPKSSGVATGQGGGKIKKGKIKKGNIKK